MMTVQIVVLRTDIPKTVQVIAKQNGKQLMKSPMKVKNMNKTKIEKQIRKDLKAYETPLYGGINIFFEF